MFSEFPEFQKLVKNLLPFFQPFSIVLEYINGKSVDNFLKEEGSDSDDKMRTKIILGAARGMKYLHSQNPPFLHLDLATRNLLINWTARSKTINNMLVKVCPREEKLF